MSATMEALPPGTGKSLRSNVGWVLLLAGAWFRRKER